MISGLSRLFWRPFESCGPTLDSGTACYRSDSNRFRVLRHFRVTRRRTTDVKTRKLEAKTEIKRKRYTERERERVRSNRVRVRGRPIESASSSADTFETMRRRSLYRPPRVSAICGRLRELACPATLIFETSEAFPTNKDPVNNERV